MGGTRGWGREKSTGPTSRAGAVGSGPWRRPERQEPRSGRKHGKSAGSTSRAILAGSSRQSGPHRHGQLLGMGHRKSAQSTSCAQSGSAAPGRTLQGRRMAPAAARAAAARHRQSEPLARGSLTSSVTGTGRRKSARPTSSTDTAWGHGGGLTDRNRTWVGREKSTGSTFRADTGWEPGRGRSGRNHARAGGPENRLDRLSARNPPIRRGSEGHTAMDNTWEWGAGSRRGRLPARSRGWAASGRSRRGQTDSAAQAKQALAIRCLASRVTGAGHGKSARPTSCAGTAWGACWKPRRQEPHSDSKHGKSAGSTSCTGPVDSSRQREAAPVWRTPEGAGCRKSARSTSCAQPG